MDHNRRTQGVAQTGLPPVKDGFIVETHCRSHYIWGVKGPNCRSKGPGSSPPAAEAWATSFTPLYRGF